jgi:hypothetical protein
MVKWNNKMKNENENTQLFLKKRDSSRRKVVIVDSSREYK